MSTIVNASAMLSGWESRITAMRYIEVVDYQDAWREKFRLEADAVQKSIGFLDPHIHHIGSTSVPGLSAKPVIDILVEIVDLDSLEKHSSALEAIGYQYRGENGIPDRLYFEKGGDDRTHQIHAFKSGSVGALRHIAFRDYLRNHPRVATEYAAIKKEVAKSCNNDIERYCDGKDDFIKVHEKLAVEWYSNNHRIQPDTAKLRR